MLLSVYPPCEVDSGEPSGVINHGWKIPPKHSMMFPANYTSMDRPRGFPSQPRLMTPEAAIPDPSPVAS